MLEVKFLKDIRVSYKQNGVGDNSNTTNQEEWDGGFIWDGDQSRSIRCCNPLCNGKYAIGIKLGTFSDSGKQEETDIIACPGSEASKAGRRVYRKCFNTMRYRFLNAGGKPQA